MRVGIVYGGTSSEAEASEKNAEAIEEALRIKGYDVLMLEYGPDMIRRIKETAVDIVYLCVQGKYHGDGTLQAMLDHEGIPYTGSKTQAAMLINDKILCKFLFDYYRIPTPKWRILRKEEYRQKRFDYDEIGFPFVGKAPTQGGSFGIELIRGPEELPKLESVFAYDDPILLEEFIDGGFYTVGLLEKDEELMTLPCVEGVETLAGVKRNRDEKLILFTGEYDIAEPDLPESCIREMECFSRQIFELVRARDVARVDFMVSRKTRKPYVLEINAVPGLKQGSLLPKAAIASGMQYDDLIEGILLSAWNSSEAGGRKYV